MTVTLVLGGARSGKSTYAERVAAASGRPVLYLATATAGDADMAARIAAHRAQRPAGWRTVEEPRDLAGAIRGSARPGDLVLIDCLTLWASNALLAALGPGDPDDLTNAAAASVEALLVAEAAQAMVDCRARDVSLALVSNEVGMGLVPPYPLGRVYRDLLGRLNQAVAREADDVVLMVAGLPVDLRRLAPDGLPD